MIIEDLIRLGRPLLGGGLSPKEVLRLISSSVRQPDFYRHVFVVELAPGECSTDPVAWEMKKWAEDDPTRPGRFVAQSEDLVLAAPFLFPLTGQKSAGGLMRYGVAAYPCFVKDMGKIQGSASELDRFLRQRLAKGRTHGFTEDILDPSEQVDDQKRPSKRPRSGRAGAQAPLGTVVCRLHAQIASASVDTKNPKSLVLLVQPTAGGAYRYEDGPRPDEIGKSKLYGAKCIVPDYARILDAFWAARFAEGAEKGEQHGTCSICGKEGRVVSVYCKAWAWVSLEWKSPLAKGGVQKDATDENLFIRGVRLDEPCYRALVLGASWFNKITRRVADEVVCEVFSHAAERESLNRARHRQRSREKLDGIYGGLYILPIEDRTLADPEDSREFSDFLLNMQDEGQRGRSGPQRHIETVTGFQSCLPEGVEQRDYRLTLVYFSGKPERGDIHLRAVIEDVLPSAVMKLRDVASDTGRAAESVLRAINPKTSQEELRSCREAHRSLPRLLAHAYGGEYLWDLLERVARRRPLDSQRPIANAARRMNGLMHRLPKSQGELNEEVVFHLAFLDFLARYNVECLKGKGDAPIMRSWQELLRMMKEDPVEALRYESPAELGFGCGVLTGEFARRYFSATDGKEYLKHRVLTFGSGLTPDAVWNRCLAPMMDVEFRCADLDLDWGFERRMGATLWELQCVADQLKRDRDQFMSAFWSGYALERHAPGMAGPKPSEQPEIGDTPEEPEDDEE